MAIAVVVVVLGAGAAYWAIAGRGSSREADCAVVDDAARQWNITSQMVIGTLVNGGGTAEAFQTVAQRQAEAADMLRGAADSVSTPEIKQHLSEWADSAARSAELHQAAADRAPGTTPPADVGEELQQLATSITDSSAALGNLCPESASGGQ